MKKLVKLFFFTLAFSVLVNDSLQAQMPATASGRIYRTQRASIENDEAISVMFAGSLYMDPFEYLGLERQVDPDGSTLFVESLKTLGNATANLYVDVSFSKRFMVSLAVNALQTYNTPLYAYVENNLSSDTVGVSTSVIDYIKFNFKYSIFFSYDSRYQLALLGGVNFARGERANEILVPYIDGVKNINLGLAFSYYFGSVERDNYYKIVPSVHFNYNLFTSVDVEKNISYKKDEPRVIRDEFPLNPILHGRFSAALEFPIRAINNKLPTIFLSLEVSGQHDINKRLPTIIYSREPFVYLTGMLRAEPLKYFILEVGIEGILYGNNEDLTDYDEGEAFNIRKLSKSGYNYPPIRGFAGIRFDIPYVNPPFYTAEAETEIQDIESLEDYERQRYDLVFKAIVRQSNEIKRAYFFARRQDTTVKAGKMTLHLEIAKNGETKFANILRSTFYPTDAVIELERKIIEIVTYWKYPKGKTDFIVRFLQFEFLEKGEMYING